MVEHVSITDPNIHEPKGVASATADRVYVSDGAGSGAWQLLNPYGGIIYNDVAGSGTTISGPTSYTLMNVNTSDTNLSGFSNNNSGRLTYTGTENRHIHAVADFSVKHSTGSGQNVFFAVFKNGAQLGDFEAAGTTDSANFKRMVLHFDDMATTNDYYEIYCKTASGNVVVHSLYLFAMGMPG